MTELATGAHFELLVIKNFFDTVTCTKIVAEMRAALGQPATVYGTGPAGAVEERTRKATRVAPLQETLEFVVRRLLEMKRTVEEHFRLTVDGCEAPQFLRYDVGDYFVAHQDGNTGLIRLDNEQARKVSVVIFLNRQTVAPAPDSFVGASLVFHEWRPTSPHAGDSYVLNAEEGMLVAFRPETTHEVTPVTYGERYSIACWYT